MTEPHDQNESTASLIDRLTSMNEALDAALDAREFESIHELVEQRGPVISALMKGHETHPVNPADVERILSFEEKLKKKMKSIQHMLGGELSTSRKHAHAHRMYSRFEPEDSI